jgi:hypothetical protein
MDSAAALGITVMLTGKRQRGLEGHSRPSCLGKWRFLSRLPFGVLRFACSPHFPRQAAMAAVLHVALHAVSVSAADRYAVIITGASGGDAYAQNYDRWRASLAAILKDKFAYSDDRLFVLAEAEQEGIAKATRENVTRLFGSLRNRLKNDDLLFIILFGHGTTADDGEGKFNLVGPDLNSSEWAELLRPISGRIVFVDTTGGSFPFMQRLAGPGRIVVTATESPAQGFETVFPEFFVNAFGDSAADADKNGRTSVWEAFAFASDSVRRWFEQRGQLPTERPLLDDNGDGIGREPQTPGADGALARVTYLAPDVGPGGNDETLTRRAELQRQLDDLRVRKASAPDPARYDAEIEKILIEIARLSREIPAKP